MLDVECRDQGFYSAEECPRVGKEGCLSPPSMGIHGLCNRKFSKSDICRFWSILTTVKSFVQYQLMTAGKISHQLCKSHG